RPIVIGGGYGLGSKDVAPNQIKPIYDHLLLPFKELKQRFTVGIVGDVTYQSLPEEPTLDLTPDTTLQAKFWGFGSDRTVEGN
ncbi:pyruvate:ferredoxin (flavodoxin) oxidoreductase, partial [Enterococcus faecalis]